MAAAASETRYPNDDIAPVYIAHIVVPAVFVLFSTVSVIFRFLSRRLNDAVGIDDWLSLGALFFAWAFLIVTIMIGVYGGGGHHSADLSAQQLKTFGKLMLTNNMMYNSSISLSKFSLLFFYKRIFQVKRFKIWVRALNLLVLAYWLTVEFGLLFSFWPIQGQWDRSVPSRSINIHAFWLSGGILNMLIDFSILFLPQPYLWRLQLSTKRRALLSVLLLVGFLTCIITIFRIVFLQRTDFDDLTHSIITFGIMTHVETNTSIICGCAPMFPNLFRYWCDKINAGKRRYSYRTSQFSWHGRRKSSESRSIDEEEKVRGSRQELVPDRARNRSSKPSTDIHAYTKSSNVERHSGDTLVG